MTSHDHCRLIELRRLHAGELTGADLERVRAHVERCAECRARVDGLEREAKVFLASVDVGVESAQILARLEASEETRASGLLHRVGHYLRSTTLTSRLGAVAAIALLAVVLTPALRAPSEGTRTKGAGVGLEMFVKDASGVRLATDHERLRSGDQIQFRYRAGGKPFVFVVSIGESGEVSPLYPDGPGKSVAVAPEGTHVLEGSVILDESKGPERVFALFSDRPLDYAEVKAALDAERRKARDVAKLDGVRVGREDADVATVRFEKE